VSTEGYVDPCPRPDVFHVQRVTGGMADTHVETEVEIEVDSSELEVEVEDTETFEAELEEPGLEIAVEAEISVAESGADTSDETDGDENYEMATSEGDEAP